MNYMLDHIIIHIEQILLKVINIINSWFHEKTIFFMMKNKQKGLDLISKTCIIKVLYKIDIINILCIILLINNLPNFNE